MHFRGGLTTGTSYDGGHLQVRGPADQPSFRLKTLLRTTPTLLLYGGELSGPCSLMFGRMPTDNRRHYLLRSFALAEEAVYNRTSFKNT